MQGWRKRMEDSHISDINIGGNEKLSAFGVFDGHGGIITLLTLNRKRNCCLG